MKDPVWRIFPWCPTNLSEMSGAICTEVVTADSSKAGRRGTDCAADFAEDGLASNASLLDCQASAGEAKPTTERAAPATAAAALANRLEFPPMWASLVYE